MPVEFIGMIATREYPEIHPPKAGYFSNAPDGFIIATDMLAHTRRLGVLLAHRPGFVSPTVAARKLAPLDRFSGGRAAVHIISGGSDTRLFTPIANATGAAGNSTSLVGTSEQVAEVAS